MAKYQGSNWMDDSDAWTINEGVMVGSEGSNTDLLLGEVYFWNIRRPAYTFSVLYSKDP